MYSEIKFSISVKFKQSLFEMSTIINLRHAFQQNIVLLKIVGAWNFEKNTFYTIYKNLLVIATFLMYFSSIISVLINFNDREVSENLYTLPAMLESPIKLIIFRKNFEKVLLTLSILKSKHFQAKNQNQKLILKKAIYYSRLLQFWYINLAGLSAGVLFIYPLIKGGYKLFITFWLPFEYQKPIYFEIVYFYVFLFSTCCAYVNVATDSFLYISWIQIGAQFDCVSDTLENLKANQKKILIQCILHYDTILKYVSLLANAYNDIIMVQVIVSTLGICTTMYQMSMVRT